MARAHIPFTGPVALNAGRKACAEMARKVNEAASSDWMSQIVRGLGGKTDVASGPHEITLEAFGPGDFHIYTSQLTSLRRDNFQTAVSLGHYVLHFAQVLEDLPGYGMQVPTDGNHPHYPDKQAGFEAIWFASELTMPEAKLRDVVEKGGPEAAKTMFLVPPRYLDMRMERLGLVEPAEVAAPSP